MILNQRRWQSLGGQHGKDVDGQSLGGQHGKDVDGQSLGGQHGKDVDGLFEKVSFQTAFEGVEKSRSAGMKALKLPPFNEDKDDLDAYLIRFELCEI